MQEQVGLSKEDINDRCLIYAIGDEDTITGLLLSGIGNKNELGEKNFFVVGSKTSAKAVENAFVSFLKQKDIAILLINQHIADQIRPLVDAHCSIIPTLLEIPSKDHPYDPEKDTVLRRIQHLFSYTE